MDAVMEMEPEVIVEPKPTVNIAALAQILVDDNPVENNPDGIGVITRKLSTSGDFADEFIKPAEGIKFPWEYERKVLREQEEILFKLFPRMSGVHAEYEEGIIPKGFNSYAMPRWESIAPTYGSAVRVVFGLLRKMHGKRFRNFRGRNIGVKYLRQRPETVAAFDTLSRQQENNDMLVVLLQSGSEWLGKAPRHLLPRLRKREFPLGVFHIGVLLLTHPERFARHRTIWIDCIGDEYCMAGDGKDFWHTPCFYPSAGQRIRFDVAPNNRRMPHVGCATGSLVLPYIQ
jgi:hypothetical protein